MSSNKPIHFNGVEYDETPQLSLVTSKWLVDAWEHLGRPDTPFSPAGDKMMAVIISTWEELYPKEAYQWNEDRKEYKKAEKSIQEQVRKHTGRSLASYPYPIFAMMRIIFKGFKPEQRDNCMKMVRKYPMFKMANKA